MKVETPLLVPALAALPVCACMAILGLPAFGNSNVLAFRSLYFVACLAWLMPLALLQRAMWRRAWRWPAMGLVLLAASYAMSVLNAVLGEQLAIALGLQTSIRWYGILRGLDGCWLALIAFCAVHAVAVYYLSLQRAQLHLAQAQADLRDAELHALRLQVHPHFLFNSLNAISALVSAQANREANHMLGCLADFLRATLAHDGRHEHTLAEELALLDAYLEIEKARLGERLRLTMKAGPALFDCVLPYLLLQPLVENAIRHGISPLAAAGRLDIRIARTDQRLLIEIDNDGRQSPRTGPDVDHDGGHGIGLANVRQRLRHLYGDGQRLDAAWDGGRFRVRVELPLRTPALPA